MYQPMIGKTPNVSRSQGITALTVSHNNIENSAKIDAEAVSPIGGGIVCICAYTCSTQFTGLCRRMPRSRSLAD